MRYVKLPLPIVIVSVLWLVIATAIAAYGFTENLRASLLPPATDREILPPTDTDAEDADAFLKDRWL